MPDRILGKDPVTGVDVIAKTGRFGAFVQIGTWTKEDQKAKINKPKSASLMKDMNIESVTLEQALACLAFPKVLGMSDEGAPITAANGRFGPYVTDKKTTASIKEPLDLVHITLEQAKELLAMKKIANTPLAEYGEDPTTKGQIVLKQGRFGHYVTDGTTNASLGKNYNAATLTRDEAIDILVKKRAAPVKKFPRRAAKTKTAE